MKIALIADLHVANHRKWGSPTYGRAAPINSRALDVINVLAEARRRAQEEGCTDMFVLGDVFDTTTPAPQLIAEVQLALACRAPNEMQVHLIPGNHDQQSPNKGDHALVSMDGIRNLAVYEKPTEVYVEGGSVALIPYQPGRADEYLVGVVQELGVPSGNNRRVLGMHLGLRDDATPPWMQNAHDSFPVNRITELGRFDMIAAGNWHERKHWPPEVWQVGALAPTGFDNPGLTGYGSLLIFNGSKTTVLELDGPRFVRATDLAGARALMAQVERRVTGYTTYVSVRCRLEERATVTELMEIYDHQAYEILTDKAAAEDAARSAATNAAYASTDSIQAAVGAFVDKMALPADVDRNEVKRLALNYVAGAAE